LGSFSQHREFSDNAFVSHAFTIQIHKSQDASGTLLIQIGKFKKNKINTAYAVAGDLDGGETRTFAESSCTT